MIRDRKGKVTPEGAEALVFISPVIDEMIEYLMSLGHGPEESVGLIVAAAVGSIPVREVRERIHRKDLKTAKVHDRGATLNAAFKKYIEECRIKIATKS